MNEDGEQVVGFVVEEVERDRPGGDNKRMIDHDRDVWLQAINRHLVSGDHIFKLVIGGKAIIFEADKIAPPSHVPQSERPHVYWAMCPRRGNPFGSSMLAKTLGYANITFDDADERHKAEQLAIEALLEYGSVYTGDKYGDSVDFTVEYNGKLFTKADFRP